MRKGSVLLRLLQGFAIGAGGILPGVSGGVLAVVFGVYRPAMELLAHPKRAGRQYWRLLLPVALGALVGFFAGAGGVLVLFRRSETAAVCLFLGLILGTLPALWRDAGAQGRTRAHFAAAVGAFAAMLALLLLLRFGALRPLQPGFSGWFFAGAVIALGVVVPGFSASPVLIAVALFSPLLDALSRADLSVLFPLALGVCAVTASLSRLVSRLFRMHPSAVSHAVFGVVLASLFSVIPTSFASSGELAVSLLCAAIGAAAAYYTSAIRSKSD